MRLDAKKLRAAIRRFDKLDGKTVDVGFFAEDKYDDGLQVAQIAQWNNAGSSFHPERPFMNDTFESKQVVQAVTRTLRASMVAGIKGLDISRHLKALGERVAELMKKAIEDYPGHNSPATIARKGFDDPLYDTGKMLASVKFKIDASKLLTP